MARDEGPVSPAQQVEAARGVALILDPLGFHLMALGNLAFLLLGGRPRASKDVDVHVFPVRNDKEYGALVDGLEAGLRKTGGHFRIEQDGASITAHVPVGDALVMVELIEGRPEWIAPEVLLDAVRTARRTPQGILVPTAEHLLVMKAEAYADRQGPRKAEFLQDLASIVEAFFPGGQIDDEEVERLVAMRRSGKREAMQEGIVTTLASVQAATAEAPQRRGGSRGGGQRRRRKPRR